MDALQCQRAWNMLTIARAHDAAQRPLSTPSRENILHRLQKLEVAYSDFVRVSQELYAFSTDPSFLDPIDDVDQCEQRYFETHAQLHAQLAELPGQPDHSSTFRDDDPLHRLAMQQATFLENFASTRSEQTVQLTKMQLPKFSGKYEDWITFRDLFLSAVGNKAGLSPTQRFQYLISYLEGDALAVVKHMRLCDNNYEQAWDRLVKRYDRKPLIIRSLVQSFVDLPSLSSPNATVLRKMVDGADQAVRGLDALDATSRDPWLVELLLRKVDEDTRKKWADTCDNHRDRPFHEALEFLAHCCDTFEACTPPRGNHNRRAAIANVAEVKSKHCVVCRGHHTLWQCDQFRQLSSSSRRSLVQQQKLCYNCLAPSHSVRACQSKYSCRQCKSRHHTLLHDEQSAHSSSSPLSPSLAQSSRENCEPVPANYAQCTHFQTPTQSTVGNSPSNSSLNLHTLLPTVLASVTDKWANKVNCRLLLDSGSTVSFVTEEFVQRVGLPRSNGSISVSGLSACNAGVTRGRVQFKLMSNISNATFDINAYILSKLTSRIPIDNITVPSIVWPSPLGDPAFSTSAPIDVLIGSDQLWTIYTGERHQLGPNMPIALNSIFGWVIAGSHSTTEEPRPTAVAHHSLVNIDALLKTFMDIETVTSTPDKMDKGDPAEADFIKTHTRHTNGSYIVHYPFKEKAPSIASTSLQAINRLHHLERRLKRDSSLKHQYVKFMREYLALGHMARVEPQDIVRDPSKCFYLAHHAVLKPDSSTTKCRVVFGGSCKDLKGVSLNERLHIGPPIQRDLFDVCIRFRQHRHVFSADIEKMFRGILVSDNHTNFQRIVWRDDEDSPIEHYRLLTVTYGLASSPFLAVRVLKQLASDHHSEYPQASRVLLNDTYVDDIATGCDTVNELLELSRELIGLLGRGNFKLQKWCSNYPALLETLPRELCEHKPIDLDSNQTVLFVKLLGLQWSPNSDEFQISIKAPDKQCSDIKKRIVLSATARIFDPLGLVSPSVVLFKTLLQELWCQGLSWDEQLTGALRDRWHTYMDELQCLSSVKVPRHIASSGKPIELHGFADASAVAYAAAVYSRVKLSATRYAVTLIASKTRVAPLKPISIPLLELGAAHLLSKLIVSITSSLTLPISDMTCWSDSEIVLHWLSSPPRRWTPFVCNRTADILDTCSRQHWHHVRSVDNPADCASRGLRPLELVRHTLWWHGPDWLSLPRSQWPVTQYSTTSTDAEVVAEQRKAVPEIVLCTQTNDNVLDNLINKSSSWTRLLRTVAFCKRFINNCQRHGQPDGTLGTSLCASELKAAANAIIRHAQANTFGADLRRLQQSQPLQAKSTLLRFTPFLDEAGILRVGERIKHASLHDSVKHPVLLSKVSNISLLICRYIHTKHLHTGVDGTFAIVRQQYWILGCRNIVRKLVFSCKACFIQRRTTSQQLMGDLPAARLQPTRCFLHSGLDYAGPVAIKHSRLRNAKIGKAWFALFVCLSTKAIHIELVSDLTTDAFLAAFRRFVARRGMPSHLYSDNGTTIHGANRVINEMHRLAASQAHLEEVSNALVSDGIQWHFIPPSAPHFGGLWESGIRSIKLHLRRVIGDTMLTFEEFSTVLSQIEAVINSRPLCATSDTESDPLTPAHFLTGAPYTAIPEPTLLDTNVNRLHRWRHLQAMVQGFWKRWHAEYLTSLQPRSKWQQRELNIEPGMIVLLKEPNLTPSKWIMGRVDVSDSAR